MAYDRINWENTPSHVTPLSAENLNTMDEAIDNIDEELNRVGVKAVNLEARMDTAETNITNIDEELTEQDTYAKGMGAKTLVHETDIATLKSQVTQIISGAPASPSEVTDIRVAENGTTYDTAGNAVRAQVRQMIEVQDTQPTDPGNKLWINDGSYDPEDLQVPTWEEFSELKADINDLYDGKIHIPYTLVHNSYVKTNGAFTTYNGWTRSDYISVTPGQILYIINPARAPYSAWYNSSKAFISRLDLSAGNPVEVTVPQDAYYVAISAEDADIFTDIWSYPSLVDDTLTQAHKAADAKVTGDTISAVNGELEGLKGAIYNTVRNNFTITLTDGSYIDANGVARTNSSSSYSNFIPVTGGVTVYLSGVWLSAIRSVCAYDTNAVTQTARIERIDDGSAIRGSFSAVLPDWAKYIRATGEAEGTMTGYEINEINKIPDDVFSGKKWVACGDSFTHGDFSNSLTDDYTFTDQPYCGENKVYPYWIGRRNPRLTVINEAVNGSTMASGENGVNPFSETRYTNIPSDTDFITLMFGINDNGNGVPIGTIDDNDNTTFYGAWNVVLSYFRTNFPFAHIGIIVGPGMQTQSGQDYANAEIAVAQKWGIPYLNIQFESGGGKIPLMLRTSNSNVSSTLKTLVNQQQFVNSSETTPNHHPNEDAHEFASNFIEEWLRTL